GPGDPGAAAVGGSTGMATDSGIPGQPGATTGSDGSPGASSGTDGGAGVPLSPGTDSCPTTALPTTPLRRLTRFEYDNSVRDLLNVDTAVVSEIPADDSDGFDNNAALQVAPDFLVEKYVLVSEALAAQAVQDLAALTSC